ncbi:MAG: hypothetical protein JJE13_07470 [Thermoleophilia bacterium]|nr:hypothetical protein [Thermoleophilia bacterium]
MIERTIPLEAHDALVLATAPLLMIGPYVLTFSPGVGLVSFFLGALLMSVALAGSTRSLPVSAHASFDLALGVTIFAIGIAAGIFGEPAVAAIFLVGFGAAHLALTAATRYSARSA